MRITPRSCCSLVLISILVVVVDKMLKHRQTHCLARWLWLSGFSLVAPIYLFKWWNDNNRMRWQMEKFTLFVTKWHSGKFETENYYYRCNCRGQCFAFICLVFVNAQQTDGSVKKSFYCAIWICFIRAPFVFIQKCKTFIKYRKQIDIFGLAQMFLIPQ